MGCTFLQNGTMLWRVSGTVAARAARSDYGIASWRVQYLEKSELVRRHGVRSILRRLADCSVEALLQHLWPCKDARMLYERISCEAAV